MPDDVFDPLAVLQALDRQRVFYIVVGALGRVIQGSDETTDGIDIVPSMREENLRRLGFALDELHARRSDGEPLTLEQQLAREDVLELSTDAGELKIIREPVGTRGYDDLRRGASREPLGHGIRPPVAALDDHARMLAALHREQDHAPLRTVRQMLELQHELTRGRVLER